MDTSKPRFDQYVGFFTVIAMVLLLYGWSWLKGLSFLHPPQRFIVTFHDIAGLNTNAPVNINGVRVGVVEKISLKSGIVDVALKINSEDAAVYKGSVYTIQTLGLVGAKYIEVKLPEGTEASKELVKPEDIQTGVDPVRTELILNKIATNIGQIDFDAKAERIAAAADSLSQTSKKFGDAAADTKAAAKNAKGFFGRGEESLDSFDNLANDLRVNSKTSFRRIDALADDWRVTSRKVNRLLDNPALSSDLKETAQKAKETSVNIQAAIHELTGVVGDKGTREDVITMLNKLNASTDNIKSSVERVGKLSDDQGVRSDVKKILADAKASMENLNKVLANKDLKDNLMGTSEKVRTAATHINFAALQMSQVLDKRAPLFHMMVGRPGHIETVNQGLDVQQKTDEKAKEIIKAAPADPEKSAPPPATVPGGDTNPDKEQTK
jgi:phospholipid/cholesterol/gamma-HCH transport system substrate-binding protein